MGNENKCCCRTSDDQVANFSGMNNNPLSMNSINDINNFISNNESDSNKSSMFSEMNQDKKYKNNKMPTSLKSYVQAKNIENTISSTKKENNDINKDDPSDFFNCQSKSLNKEHDKIKENSKVNTNNQINFFDSKSKSVFSNNIKFMEKNRKLKNKSINNSSSSLINPKNNEKAILLQSIYNGYKFRRKYNNSLKSKLKENLDILLKNLYTKYLTNNLKSQEKLSFNILHNENSYKQLYKERENCQNKQNKNKIKTFYSQLYVFTFNNKPSFYVGELDISNNLNGHGILTQNDGTKYIGIFQNNIFKSGKLIDCYGNYYEGSFINCNLIDGVGIKKTLNGIVYQGDFKNGKKEGKGKEDSIDQVYEGDFKNDKRNGKGKLINRKLNDVYEGDFKDNCITGVGHYTWDSRETYFGTFLNGKMHGRGKYQWVDGGFYEGQYINNLKEGQGVFKWSNGRTYIGEFKKGKPDGTGVLICKRNRYRVVFKNGKVIKKTKDVSDRNINMNTKTNQNESKNDLELMKKKKNNQLNRKNEEYSNEGEGNNDEGIEENEDSNSNQSSKYAGEDNEEEEEEDQEHEGEGMNEENEEEQESKYNSKSMNKKNERVQNSKGNNKLNNKYNNKIKDKNNKNNKDNSLNNKNYQDDKHENHNVEIVSAYEESEYSSKHKSSEYSFNSSKDNR